MPISLFHGDCLELLPSIPSDSVHLVFADLPYGVTQNKWDTPIDLTRLWAELLRVGKRNAAFVFTATFPFSGALWASRKDLFRYDIAWAKQQGTGFQNANYRPMAAHENILVFSRATANSMSKLRITYNPQKTPGKPFKKSGRTLAGLGYKSNLSRESAENADGMRHPTTVVYFDNPRMKAGHPTQKPVALLEWLIRTYSNPGDTVLDPTMGSGTTGCACVSTGRSFIGMEKDATYFETAEKRIAAAETGATP